MEGRERGGAIPAERETTHTSLSQWDGMLAVLVGRVCRVLNAQGNPQAALKVCEQLPPNVHVR